MVKFMKATLKEKYEAKKITVDEALSMVKSGDEIVVGFCALEPATFLSKLHNLAGKVSDVTIWSALTLGNYPYFSDPNLKEPFTNNSWFFSMPTRKANSIGNMSYSPANLHDGFIRKLQNKRPDIFVGTVASMDEHGYFKSSLSALYEKAFSEAAKLVIMEVNPRLPQVWGDTEFFIDDVDYFIEVDRPVPVLPDIELTKDEITIGEYVATLVNDGDTIQLGIGGIPNAVAKAFMNKHDLGVHTEMITSAMAELAESGVVTGKKKTLHKGKMIGTFVLGNQRLYDYINNNPSVNLLRGEYVNNPLVIAQNDNMVSINTALQVDITGQVCAESLGTKVWSGTGGQSDTALGAIHAKNGRSIIALTSTVKNGTVSTIQPVLSPGSIVTLSRNNVDYIVTEYGIAYLKAMPVRNRVDNLIAIAHPDFRNELYMQAKKFEII